MTIAQKVKVYDNLGESADRYTVVFGKHLGVYPYYAMSAQPRHPWGICQYGELKQSPGDYLGKKISFASLPEDCRKFIESYFKDDAAQVKSA